MLTAIEKSLVRSLRYYDSAVDGEYVNLKVLRDFYPDVRWYRVAAGCYKSNPNKIIIRKLTNNYVVLTASIFKWLVCKEKSAIAATEKLDELLILDNAYKGVLEEKLENRIAAFKANKLLKKAFIETTPVSEPIFEEVLRVEHPEPVKTPKRKTKGRPPRARYTWGLWGMLDNATMPTPT